MTECALLSPEIVELCRLSNDTELCIHEKCPKWKTCELPELGEETDAGRKPE